MLDWGHDLSLLPMRNSTVVPAFPCADGKHSCRTVPGKEALMLEQEAMIERVRELCGRDERLVAALMYGSLAHGEGDR